MCAEFPTDLKPYSLVSSGIQLYVQLYNVKIGWEIYILEIFMWTYVGVGPILTCLENLGPDNFVENSPPQISRTKQIFPNFKKWSKSHKKKEVAHTVATSPQPTLRIE